MTDSPEPTFDASPLSAELRELACLLGDSEWREIDAHPLWPVYVALFQAETGTAPPSGSPGALCSCPIHF